MQHLVEFGSRCQIIENQKRVEKLQPLKQKRYMAGYTPIGNTYVIYVPAYLRTTITCDVIFGPHRRETFHNETKGGASTEKNFSTKATYTSDER